MIFNNSINQNSAFLQHSRRKSAFRQALDIKSVSLSVEKRREKKYVSTCKHNSQTIVFANDLDIDAIQLCAEH